MNSTPTVEYERFVSLGGMDLYAYMEPLVVDPRTTVSANVLQHMLSELPTYDEYHLVYALTLGAKHSPETYAACLPLYLAHEQGSVSSAALNGLDQLPGNCVTKPLVDSVRRIQSLYPSKAWIAESLARLEQRLREAPNQ